jgi:hypothetical protein
VRVFFYLEDRERTLDGALEKVMLSLTNFAAEMEREKARQRTYDAMARKARAGHVAGGSVYGYRNVEVLSPTRSADGRATRLHVERQIHPEQAAVVRRIFEFCAAGQGLVRIAKRLNAEGISGPRPRHGRGWAPTAIREMLHREAYRGRLIWNRTRWVDRGGTKVKVDRPAAEWLTVDAPHLRIISETLWQAAHARLDRTRAAYRTRWTPARIAGRPEAGLESPYLLTGFLACAACGGSFLVRNRRSGHAPFAVHSYYACTYHRLRGARVCPNGLTVPMGAANEAILGALGRQALAPEVVVAAIDQTIRRWEVGAALREPDHRAVQEALHRVESELCRLTEALAHGEAPPTILEAIRTRERQRAELQEQARHLARPTARPSVTRAAPLATVLRDRLTDWQGLLERNPREARPVLRELLVGRIVLTPRRDAGVPHYRFEGRVTYGPLLLGAIGAKELVPPG